MKMDMNMLSGANLEQKLWAKFVASTRNMLNRSLTLVIFIKQPYPTCYLIEIGCKEYAHVCINKMLML